MKITSVKTMHANAGWRPWTFIKIETDTGPVGWSECTDSHGSPRGIAGVVEDLAPLVVGKDPRSVSALVELMRARTRQSPGSIIQKAMGGIENALWDITARVLNVPVHALFGGPLRAELPLYWSHCGTTRVRAHHLADVPRIKTKADARRFGALVRASGFRALKTNIAVLGKEPFVYMPGFAKSAGGPERNASREMLDALEEWIAALREGVGDVVDIILDCNFNFTAEGCVQVARRLEPYHLLWIEIDSYHPAALRMIKNAIATPLASCENLYGLGQYYPYFEKRAMDIASIDVIWNGWGESRTIAAVAALHDMNVTPHNYNGHLSTFISAQFCSLVPNLRIMEIDVDDVPWRSELFTHEPHIQKGMLTVPQGPGWGTAVNERALKKHPWPAP